MKTFLVSGTDTDVGKTIFTGFVGVFLRKKGFSLGIAKPFCSGGRFDIEYLSKGRCAMCGKFLNPSNWEADHIQPWSKGGPTEHLNGQALCIPCHQSKT